MKRNVARRFGTGKDVMVLCGMLSALPALQE
jgi:hypothetical protein